MARQEHEREDLLRDAVALVERAELRWPGAAEPLVVGFRRDGAASIYFGGEPVYHFTSRGELRRAYDAGLLYKSDGGQLVSLRRQRTPGEVQLLRHDLTEDEASQFFEELVKRMAELRDRVGRGTFTLVGQAPADADILGRIARWLETLALPPPLAQSPRAR